MSYKTYEKYKSSNVEWIGDIPTHWQTNRLKFLITKNAQYGANCEPESDEIKSDYRYIRITDIDDDGSLKDNIVYLSKEDAKDFVLKEGDILFARSGATVGKTYLYNQFDGNCCFAGYLIRYIPNKQLLNPKYLFYFTFSKSYSEWIKIASTQATIQNVSADKYDNLIVPLPNIKEQNYIISYLDKKTAKIDATIAKNEELIRLLEEKRVALINQVITKGLNPDVAMKDSGVEWIGEIPEHWDVVPLTKFLKSIVDYRGKTPEKVENGIFLVTGKNIKKGKLQYHLSQEYVKKDEYNQIMSRGKPEIGDLLFTTEAPLGEVANIDDPNVALAQRIIKMSGKDNIVNNYFLKYYMMSATFQSHLQSLATGSTAQGIKASKLFLLKLLLLPYKEQQEITNHLDNETNKLNNTILKIEKNISLLEEYKTSLIHHVVTGKIDVRGEEI